MSLDELSDMVKEGLEPVIEQADDHFEDLLDVVNETTALLNVWDGETEEGVQLLHHLKEEHVRSDLYIIYTVRKLPVFKIGKFKTKCVKQLVDQTSSSLCLLGLSCNLKMNCFSILEY